MKTADLYIRVSTDEQADKGYSQRSQENVLTKYCEIHNIAIRSIFFEDHSAKTFERPEWKKLMAQIRKNKSKTNLILFTKWDRFSRNASDAYQVLSQLKKLAIEAQAVEQPLDMSVPENKIMLAVYLTTPEVENDRRSMNVVHGMIQARKEGRWMGFAPPGYINRTKENGDKYVAIDEPQATHMRWAFHTLAQGQFNTAAVWTMAVSRGLVCKRPSFWKAIRNVGYCGKVVVPAYKNQESYLVTGLHEPLISEALFYQVQDVLDGRKRDKLHIGKQGVKKTSPNLLPLRGFLLCPVCELKASGSASKGYSKYFHYYHCQFKCRWRVNAEDANAEFVKLLCKLIPKAGIIDLFTDFIKDLYSDSERYEHAHKKNLISQITDKNNRVTRARELLLNDSLTSEEYKQVRTEAEETINRLEAQLKEMSAGGHVHVDINGVLYRALHNFEKLDLLFLNEDVTGKRRIISSIFPKKLVFEDGGFRTPEMSVVASLIYQVNNRLRKKKGSLRTEKSDLATFVPKRRFELPHP